MRVLWFSVTASCYSSKQSTSHNGGGWISSLEKIVRTHKDIELGIAFEFASTTFKESIDGVTYYPINIDSPTNKITRKFSIAHEEHLLLPKCLKIIEDFKPDIIQCFGTEWCFGLIAKHTSIPVVIHMQGSMPSYFNALYPPRYNKWTSIAYDLSKFRFKRLAHDIFEEHKARQRTNREFRIFKANKYFLGRTEWDKNIVELLSPDSSYFICNEALRDSFYYASEQWMSKKHDTITLCTTGNGSLWKGLDVVLKTASLLTNRGLKFQWKIIGGVDNIQYIEWIEKLSFKKSNITLTGVLNESELKRELLDADIYVHPAYIDNSPNALCEAMILGLPCIASYVGGVPSIIEHNVSGLLTPVNEPYFLANEIIKLASDTMRQERYSKAAIQQARQRHSTTNIATELITAYNAILNIK